MESWHDFLVAEVGASAALVGLLFVSVSLNLKNILATHGLANRALLALILLGTVLIAASLMLIPDQPRTVLGAEIALIGAAAWIFGTYLDIRSWCEASEDNRHYFMRHLVMDVAAVVPYAIGGVLYASAGSGALYWIAGAMIVSIFTAVMDSWVLLVEIYR